MEKVYTVREFRSQLSSLLDLADRGDGIFLKRGSRRYVLNASLPPSLPKTPRSPASSFDQPEDEVLAAHDDPSLLIVDDATVLDLFKGVDINFCPHGAAPGLCKKGCK